MGNIGTQTLWGLWGDGGWQTNSFWRNWICVSDLQGHGGRSCVPKLLHGSGFWMFLECPFCIKIRESMTEHVLGTVGDVLINTLPLAKS